MNKKGYLLSELIVSFSLSFIILLAIFNTTINLNQKLSDLFVENKAASQQIIFNRKIGRDFSSKKVEKIESNGENCLISYKGFTTKTLIVHKKTGTEKSSYIEYDKERINLPDNTTIGTVSCNINNGLAIIKVPIIYSRLEKDYGIELYNLSSEFK